MNCIQAVQNRATRYFLNTPVAAVNDDTAWYPMECRLWKSVLNYWCHYFKVNMDNSRLNKHVFIWCDFKSTNSCKNWNFRGRKQFHKYDDALPGVGAYLFPCSPEINWLLPLFPKNRKIVFLCSLFPNIVLVPLFSSKFGIYPLVPLK